MDAFVGVHTPQGDGSISRTPKGRQAVSKILAGDDAILSHPISPPCPHVEELASWRRIIGMHPEGRPSTQRQSNFVGNVGPVPFEGSSQVFAIHDVQYVLTRRPLPTEPDGLRRRANRTRSSETGTRSTETGQAARRQRSTPAAGFVSQSGDQR